MSRSWWFLLAMAVGSLLVGCGEKEEVVVSTNQIDTESAIIHLVRMHGNLLAEPLPNPEVEDVRVNPENPEQVEVTVINKGLAGDIIVELQTIAEHETVETEKTMQIVLRGGADQPVHVDLALSPKAQYRASVIEQDEGVNAIIKGVSRHELDPTRAVMSVRNEGEEGRARFLVKAVLVKDEIIKEQTERLSLPEGARHKVVFNTRLPDTGRFNATARPREKPQVIAMLTEGDELQVLEKKQAWVQVRHNKSGKTGWINESFVQAEQRSTWWSGDTENARRVARKIYLDKNIVKQDWPIEHVNIEERFNRLAFSVKEDSTFSRDQAKECARHFLNVLRREFPTWSEKQIFINAKDVIGGYTMVMDEDGNAMFM